MKKFSKIEIPMLSDPRFVFIGFFSTFIINALLNPFFAKTVIQFLLAVCTSLTLDLIFTLLRGEEKYRFPLSGLVTPLGLFLFLDTEWTIFYCLGACLAQLSKHLLRYRGRHFFNPNNFGIVTMLIAFPNLVSSSEIRWGGSVYWLFLTFLFGSILVCKANRWVVSATYLISFYFLSLAISLVSYQTHFSLGGSLLGPGAQIYTFFMISDPVTTPGNRKGQFFYAFLIAAIDCLFRVLEIPHSNFFALFVVLALYGIYRIFFLKNEEASDPWKTKTISLG